MSDALKPLSLRQERFVHEYLKDPNATQAYIRAGYAVRGAQPSASKLLRQPQVEAALAAGRQRMAQALEVTVERLAAEYAKVAFANVDDFIAVDGDGGVRIDLAKAGRAARAGIVELSVADHGKQGQRVKLKLAKLQALDALVRQLGVLVEKPAPGLTAEDRARYEERCAGYERVLDHRNREQVRVEQELRATRAALEAVQAKNAPTMADTPPPPQPVAALPEELPPEELVSEPPPARHVPGVAVTAEAIWRNYSHPGGLSSAEALRRWAKGNPSYPRRSPGA